MNKHQIAYGKERIAELAKDLNLPQRKIIDILLSAHDIIRFYDWKNADDFIIAVENGEILLEES
jgi:hypothetical protein